ncbi:toxin-antitoxin system YwqK family antitoxin [Muriicola marianensis]|uniref:toxin-antitoxin system YwqK family antitoxin n=1 Tax=Muriicola marianensis TaxID=1324801 RepID=UPI00166D2E06|nr:nicotinic acid mononucleotide adenyltransferase [Muriicola marianensis]
MKKYISVMMVFLMTIIAYGQKEKDLVLNEETGLIEATYYHDNGVVSQKGTFNLDRQLHGEWISFNEEGVKISQGTYENGMRSGKWYFWQGDTVKEVVYNNNMVASVDGKKKSSEGLVKND